MAELFVSAQIAQFWKEPEEANPTTIRHQARVSFLSNIEQPD
jgi:hypothetical protein